MAATAQADVLTESELNAWLSAVGSLRLVLGTRLDVSEDMEAPDPEDPTAAEYALYELSASSSTSWSRCWPADLPARRRPDRSTRGAPVIPLLISKSPDRVWSPHRLAA